MSLTRDVQSLDDSWSRAARPNTSPSASPIKSSASFSGKRSLRIFQSRSSPPSAERSSRLRCSTASQAAPSSRVYTHGPRCLGVRSLIVAILARHHCRHLFSALPVSSPSPLKRLKPFSSPMAELINLGQKEPQGRAPLPMTITIARPRATTRFLFLRQGSATDGKMSHAKKLESTYIYLYLWDISISHLYFIFAYVPMYLCIFIYYTHIYIYIYFFLD